MSFGARARINLSAIRHNLGVIKGRAPAAKIMAVIKANAYGHGLIPVAQVLPDVDALAVARLAEAVRLREAGISNAIVLMGGVMTHDEFDTACKLDVQVCVHDDAQVAAFETYRGRPLAVWLKIDTGMNRLGFDYQALPAVLNRLATCKGIASMNFMTHFANADDPGDEMTLKQLDRLLVATERCPGDISVANSAAIFSEQPLRKRLAELGTQASLWIRPGLTLFGVSPFSAVSGVDLGLLPAMQFESKLIAVKPLAAGEPVGYGGTWRSSRDTLLGIIAAGYGDGYARAIPSGTPVLLNGRRVPVAGRISMDLTAVDLGPAATERPGEPVILWGRGLAVETIADMAGTIPYQLLCGVTHREMPVFEPYPA